MVVKSDAGNIAVNFVLFGITIVLIIMCINDGDGSVWGLCPIWIIMIAFGVSNWMVVGRTLIMDAKGCTVCFLCYRRRYQWAELQVKHVEYCNHGAGYKLPYTEGVVFISKKAHGPRKLYDLLDYNSACPFSSFFVYFQPEEMLDKGIWDIGKYYRGFYEVDKGQFMEMLEGWNVEIQESIKC